MTDTLFCQHEVQRIKEIPGEVKPFEVGIGTQRSVDTVILLGDAIDLYRKEEIEFLVPPDDVEELPTSGFLVYCWNIG